MESLEGGGREENCIAPLGSFLKNCFLNTFKLKCILSIRVKMNNVFATLYTTYFYSTLFSKLIFYNEYLSNSKVD